MSWFLRSNWRSAGCEGVLFEDGILAGSIFEIRSGSEDILTRRAQFKLGCRISTEMCFSSRRWRKVVFAVFAAHISWSYLPTIAPPKNYVLLVPFSYLYRRSIIIAACLRGYVLIYTPAYLSD